MRLKRLAVAILIAVGLTAALLLGVQPSAMAQSGDDWHGDWVYECDPECQYCELDSECRPDHPGIRITGSGENNSGGRKFGFHTPVLTDVNVTNYSVTVHIWGSWDGSDGGIGFSFNCNLGSGYLGHKKDSNDATFSWSRKSFGKTGGSWVYTDSEGGETWDEGEEFYIYCWSRIYETDSDDIDFNVALIDFSVNGETMEIPGAEDHCLPISEVQVTGDPTATVGVAEFYEATTAPAAATEPITYSWAVQPPPDVERPDAWFDDVFERSSIGAQYWETGTYTVHVAAANECSAVTDALTVTVEESSWEPPFDPGGPIEPPEFPPTCACPTPDWAWWQITKWIYWLWCEMLCYLEWFVDFLAYLWDVLMAFLKTLANGALEVIWTWALRIASSVDRISHQLASQVWVRGNIIADAFRGLVFFLRDTGSGILTWLANYTDQSFDEAGNTAEAWILDVRDFTDEGLTELAEQFNAWGGMGEMLGNTTIDFRDSLYEHLTEWADFFGSWGTEMGDFLAASVIVVRDFIYALLTEMANLFYGYAQLMYTLEDWTLQVRDWSHAWLTEFAEAVNSTLTWLGDFLAEHILDFRDWFYESMTNIGNWGHDAIVSISAFVAASIIWLGDELEALIFGISWHATSAIFSLVAYWDALDAAVDAAVKGLHTLAFIADLFMQLMTGVRNSLNSSAEAELYISPSGGLYYFWAGLMFFEETVSGTPIAAANLIVSGLIGVQLTLWTSGQVMDFLEDIQRA